MVTFTGDGAQGKAITGSAGIAPDCIFYQVAPSYYVCGNVEGYASKSEVVIRRKTSVSPRVISTS
jgi:hypothetical protein